MELQLVATCITSFSLIWQSRLSNMKNWLVKKTNYKPCVTPWGNVMRHKKEQLKHGCDRQDIMQCWQQTQKQWVWQYCTALVIYTLSVVISSKNMICRYCCSLKISAEHLRESAWDMTQPAKRLTFESHAQAVKSKVIQQEGVWWRGTNKVSLPWSL